MGGGDDGLVEGMRVDGSTFLHKEEGWVGSHRPLTLVHSGWIGLWFTRCLHWSHSTFTGTHFPCTDHTLLSLVHTVLALVTLYFHWFTLSLHWSQSPLCGSHFPCTGHNLLYVVHTFLALVTISFLWFTLSLHWSSHSPFTGWDHTSLALITLSFHRYSLQSIAEMA
jgi:hypothetical protein